MRNTVVLGTSISGANFGVQQALVGVVGEQGMFHISQADAQVISAIITVAGSFLVALFMHFLHINYSDKEK